MFAARDEHNVLTGLRQPAAEVAAYGTRTHDRYTHLQTPNGMLVVQ
jgi:hypothetical protein